LAKSVVLPDVHVEDDDDNEHNYRAARAAATPPRLYNKQPVATASGTLATAAAVTNVVVPSPSDPIIPRLYNRDENMDQSLTSSTRNDEAAVIPRLYNRTDPETPLANAASLTRPLVVEQEQKRLGTTPSLAPLQNDVYTDGRVVPETAGLLIPDDSNYRADVEDAWGDDDDLSLDNNGADDEVAQPDTTTGVVAMDDDDSSPPAAPVGTKMRHTTTATIVNRKRWVNPRLHARRSLFLVSK
jgi:hypothetical protein